MSVHTKKHITLMPADKNIIFRGEWLTDVHMEHFKNLLRNCSEYTPVDTWRIQLLDTIQPIPVNKKHIQILHSSSGTYDGHWVCSYYDTKNIFIYDSLNAGKLHMHHELFLKRLFPTYDFRKPYAVKFPVVQYQPNGNDCGVFAIAFAVSLLFNIKPEKIKYDCSLMRSHLIKILETNIIEHFPQDPRSLPIKVPPLAVVKDREAKAAYIRVKRQSEKNYINSKNNSYPTICKINNKNTFCLNNEENNIMCVKSAQGEIVKNKEHENKLEKYRLTNRKSYMKHLEENRKRKRCRYEEKLEYNQAIKRCRYQQKLEINRAKDRHRYKKNRVKRCAQRTNTLCYKYRTQTKSEEDY